MSRMSRLVRKVVLPIAIAAGALAGVCVLSNGTQPQVDAGAGDSRAKAAVYLVANDMNWG
ncbi:hypothetical protein OG618_19005 [Kitasatospora sp. NBC_01246]|uniref:hypothetical protein n=1 Tax=unclassified Kitasatospora TaxID=2633591 RepID=UPI002E353958|nr:hypothetical protein [Kitasatospora sp. NBC_01246]